ncbi:hypothetical protein [Paenibacillus sp. PAMC21692]|uniref:hypothetical protein n=1 Tax=Paenibacillus sp. PAMC21692 TaxID=2762320 RepID=UPI00164D8CA4|nr:hypothetical protein [Paenibacillus sp. PAMC21692]QNK54903.1 hypothetical protein H7F31_19900 [Paenibacillus sp. PAMC21692]
MGFEVAHAAFIQNHLNRRNGERRGRLERGHRHGEKLFCQNIWWELKGSFDALHPEYEVTDWRGKSYFADFAYKVPGSRVTLIWEIKGFNSHVKEMDRNKFCMECKRELYLEALGFRVISIAYDDLENNPGLIVSLIRMLLSQYEMSQTPCKPVVFEENEAIRLAVKLSRPIRPKDVEDHFEINHRTAVRILKSLYEKGCLLPVSRGRNVRIVQYELTRAGMDSLWQK